MIELGLQRISRLLATTPLPWRAIHVAGTNGKGSVCAYISEMLNTYNRSSWREKTGHSQIRHGRFTSPHVVDRWDCISMDSEAGMEAVNSELFFEIEEKINKRNRDMNINASEFELLTAVAFDIFTHSKIDVGVIETGMGGRLDATNVIGHPLPSENTTELKMPLAHRAQPLVTAITKIGLDHQAFLGGTIEVIAREKAGIFKPGVPALWDYSNQQSVIRVLEAEALQKSSPAVDWADSLPGSDTLTWRAVREHLTDAWLAMSSSQHVRDNIDVALRAVWLALSSLDRLNVASRGDDHSSSLQDLVDRMIIAPQQVQLPGRLEWINISDVVGSKVPPVLLDGAHNAQSAEALAKTVDTIRRTCHSPVNWIIATSNTKDVKEILRPLLRENDRLFAVEFGPVDGMPWVAPTKPSQIIAAAAEVVPKLKLLEDCGSDIIGALKTATAMRGSQPAHSVVAGSLYLVGDVHRCLRSRKLP